jgi:replicative DNA helicase
MTSLLDKIPPQSLEAEQAALGAMLMERDAIAHAAEFLTEADFYRESHRYIYRGCVELMNRRLSVDLISIGEWLKERDMFETIGGTLFLTTCMAHSPTSAGIGHYCDIIRAKATQRALIKAADEIILSAYEPGELSLLELQAECESKIQLIGDRVNRHDIDCQEAKIGKLMAKELNRYDEEQEHDPPPGIMSNLYEVNKLIEPGLQPGEVFVLAGLTSMGKSVLAVQNFGIATAREKKYTVLYLGCEMAQMAIARRCLAANSSNTNLWQMKNLVYRRNNFTQFGDRDRDSRTELPIAPDLAQTIDKAWNWPFYCFYEPGLTPARIRAICRRARREVGLGLLIIDGLWLMEPDKATSKEYEAVTRNMKQVKNIAGEFNIPVILVHQLNRYMNNKEKGNDYLPQCADLRSSGEIEQSADYVCFVHRPRHMGDERFQEEDTKILMRKNRSGVTGEALALFEGNRSRFKDFIKAENEPQNTYQP